MAVSSYVGYGGVSRKISKGYVGYNGVSRKLKTGYVGYSGVTRPIWRTTPASPSWISGILDPGQTVTFGTLNWTVVYVDTTNNYVILTLNQVIPPYPYSTSYAGVPYNANVSRRYTGSDAYVRSQFAYSNSAIRSTLNYWYANNATTINSSGKVVALTQNVVQQDVDATSSTPVVTNTTTYTTYDNCWVPSKESLAGWSYWSNASARVFSYNLPGYTSTGYYWHAIDTDLVTFYDNITSEYRSLWMPYIMTGSNGYVNNMDYASLSYYSYGYYVDSSGTTYRNNMYTASIRPWIKVSLV